jgi:hypothetical protein
MMKRSLYANVMATCGSGSTSHDKQLENTCYIVNDGIDSFSGEVLLTAVNIADGKSGGQRPGTAPNATLSVVLAPGPGVRQFFSIPSAVWDLGADGSHVFESSVVDTATGDVVSHHVILPMAPKDLKLARANVTFVVGAQQPGPAREDLCPFLFCFCFLFLWVTVCWEGKMSQTSHVIHLSATVIYVWSRCFAVRSSTSGLCSGTLPDCAVASLLVGGASLRSDTARAWHRLVAGRGFAAI